jgi:hypothetical protein
VRRVFDVDLKAIRDWEKQCEIGHVNFAANKKEIEELKKLEKD